MNWDDLRFEFGERDPRGERDVVAIVGGDVSYNDRFDDRKSWLRDKFYVALADKLPYQGAIVEIADRFEEATKDTIQTKPKRTETRDEIISAVPFPMGVLPPILEKVVTEVSKSIGCSIPYVVLPLLACLSRAIGNKRAIQLKRTWKELAIIWGMIVGKSGTHKTPALQAATAALDRKQSDAIAKYQDDLENFQQELVQYEKALTEWKRSKSQDQPPWEPKQPVCQRFITSDATIEAVASLLAVQSDGLLVRRDEMSGWLDGMAEYKNGSGSDTGHWLACWSGAPLTVDRKTGAIKFVHIPRASISIIGGIQPEILRRAIGREHLKDGLCARMLLAMPESKPVQWTDATVDPATEKALEDVIDKLLSLEPAADENGNPTPFAVPLSQEAKLIWVEYYNRHRNELSELDDDLAAAWSKLEAYTARFALIFQLCSWATGDALPNEVDEESIRSGIALSDWFGTEAKRVYGVLSETDEQRDRRELVELIERKGGTITTRELTQASRIYRAAGDAEAAIEGLIKAGFGSWKVEPTSGRPRTTFVLSNSVYGSGSHENNGKNIPSVTAPRAFATNEHADPEAINRMLHEAGDTEPCEPF